MSRSVAGPSEPSEADLETYPANALFLDFQGTDGDESRWPVYTGRTVNGEINYMRPVDLMEKGNFDWRKKVGSKLAEMLGYDRTYWPPRRTSILTA